MEFLFGTDPQTGESEFLLRIGKREISLVPYEVLKMMIDGFGSCKLTSEKLIILSKVVQLIEESESLKPDVVFEIHKILRVAGIL